MRIDNARYLDQQAVADYLMVSRATVGQLVERGKLPKPLELSPRLKRWDRAAIDAAMASGAVVGRPRPDAGAIAREIADEIAQGRPARQKAAARR